MKEEGEPRSVVRRRPSPQRRANGRADTTTSPRRPRDAAETAKRILDAAIIEFADHGYMGARIDAIARRGETNMRMLYHYFGNKEELYVKVLETVFGDIRGQEQNLDLKNLEPLAAMMSLFDFTYSHFANNPLFIRILTGENLMEARHLARSQHVPQISSPFLDVIADVLARGERDDVFRSGIDPLQLYVTMVALSYFHISNGPTLSQIFGVKMGCSSWRAERRSHAGDLLQAYLQPVKVATPNVDPLANK